MHYRGMDGAMAWVTLVGGPLDGRRCPEQWSFVHDVADPGLSFRPEPGIEPPEGHGPRSEMIYEPDLDGDPEVYFFRGWS